MKVVSSQWLVVSKSGFGFVQPGGNITGFTNLGGYLGGKRLELLKEAVGKVARVAVLYQANNPRNMFEFKEVLPASARALGLTLQRREVSDADDFERAFAAINKDRPDGLHVLSGPLMNANRKRTIGFALKSRLPSMYDSKGICRGWWAHVLRGGQRGELPACRLLRGQNPERGQACRSAGGAADEIRVGDQSQNGQADRPDDSAETCWRGRIKSLSNGSTLLTAKDMKKKITVLTLCAMLFALCSFRRRAADRKNLPHRFPGCKHCFR